MFKTMILLNFLMKKINIKDNNIEEKKEKKRYMHLN
jgi:hypothetical protein